VKVRQVKIGDVCMGTSQRDPRNHPARTFRYVDISTIDRGTKQIVDPPTILGTDAPSRARKQIQVNDVLVSTVRPNLNAVAIVPEWLDAEIASTGFCVLRANPDAMNARFLYYRVRTPEFVRFLCDRTTGASYPAVTDGIVKHAPVPLPSLPEQVRIVEILDAAEKLRQLREQAYRRTACLIPALFHEMFGDPATNPKGWPIVPVREVMTTCEYGTSTKGNDEGRGIPVLRMGNVTVGGYLDVSDLKHVELQEAEKGKYLLQAGDVLFNRTNSRELVGKTGMWDGRFPAVAASYFIRLRFDDKKEHPQHFTTFMNLPNMKRELAAMARGAVGQANINGKELQAIRFPLPPIKLQREFAARVVGVQAMEANQVSSRRRLDDLFQSLLHRAFRGEL